MWDVESFSVAPGPRAFSRGGLAIAVGLRRGRVLYCRGVVVPLLVVGKKRRRRKREKQRGGRERERGDLQGHGPGDLLLPARPHLLVPHT